MPTIAAKGNTSKVQLTLFGLYRTHGVADAVQLSPLVGVDALSAEDGKTAVTLSSVPFHDRAMDRLAPQQGQGMLCLFGIRDALEELQHWRAVARNSNTQFAYLQLTVDIGCTSSGVLTRSHLQQQRENLRFVNVKRCAADMQKQWLQQFAQWVEQEGAASIPCPMSHVRHMAARPDLFERLLYTDPDLQHIDVMVFPLADRNDIQRVRQVAYLRAGTPLLAMAQGSDLMHAQLPAWMGQRFS